MSNSGKSRLSSRLVGNYYGFLLMGCAFAQMLVLRKFDAAAPQILNALIVLTAVAGFVGQFIVAWQRSKGLQILILLNIVLLFFGNRTQFEQGILTQIYVIVLITYMYPTILLFRRKHKRRYLLALVNFIAGIYVIPWLLLLRMGLKLPRISSKRFH